MKPQPTEIAIPTCHRVDFTKVKTVTDLKLIVDAMQPIFYDNYEDFHKIKHLLSDVNEK